METDLLNNSSTLQHGKLSTLDAIRATMKKKKKSKSKKLLKKSDKPIKKAVLSNQSNVLQIPSLNFPINDPQIPNIIIQTGDDPEKRNNVVRLKDKLTEKELSFLSSYLSGGVTIDEAMIQAGYGAFHERYRYSLASKIVQRYESQTADHRIIARALGAGEVFVIRSLMDLAKDSTSGLVKRAALADLAKILGLTKESIQGGAGVTVIIQAQDGSKQQVNVGTSSQTSLPGPTSPSRPQSGNPGQPITIVD